MPKKSQKAGECNAERQRPTGGEKADQRCGGKKWPRWKINKNVNLSEAL